jgi:hypothetical protein
MIWFSCISILLAAPSPEGVREAMAHDDQWKEMGTEKTSIGPVKMRHLKLPTVDCLEASATTQSSIPKLMSIVIDVQNNPEWTSADIVISRVLAQDANQLDYLQVLSNPAPIADRYWYLRGNIKADGKGQVFKWEGIPGSSLYPDIHSDMKAKHSGSVELAFNIGSWAFYPEGDQTLARFRGCTDAGGKVPRWLGEALAEVMLPNNIVDLLTYASK